MLTKILSTATLIVVAWLAVQVLHTQRALVVVQSTFNNALTQVREEQSESSKQNEALGADVLQRMELFSVEQVKMAKTASQPDPKLLKAKDQKIAQLTQSASMQEVVANVLKAELLSAEKQGKQAAEILISTKSSIWKLSGQWSKSKDALRGLMAPIDVLAGKWKREDFSGNSKAIQKILQTAITAQPKS